MVYPYMDGNTGVVGGKQACPKRGGGGVNLACAALCGRGGGGGGGGGGIVIHRVAQLRHIYY